MTEHANGAAVRSKRRKSSKKQRNAFLSLFDWILRLTFWGTVLSIVFTCPPANELNSDSSALCKSYQQVRSHIVPYVAPVYDQHIKPYIDKAQPHVDNVNQNVYTPAAGFVTKHYGHYAAPRVAQAQEYVCNEWSARVQPKIDTGKDWSLEQYNQNLAPHVTAAWKVASPYANQIQLGSVDFYQNSLVPGYQKALPHAQNGYYHFHNFLTRILVPYAQTGYSTVSTTFFKHVWPQLVILYGENVEPQITRITQRLGRYRDSQKVKAVFKAESSSISIESVATASVARESTAVVANESTDIPLAADPRETIESDLQQWKSTFAIAADKGTEDLNDRVKEISEHQIKAQAQTVGQALVIQLGNAVEHSLKDLKTHINNSISKMPSDTTESDEDVVYDELLQYIRSSGEQIRQKAMAVRSWKQSYDNETESLVKAAVQSTLDVVDNIRDLGLQQMGMRWASLEGVGYKDWSKYHDLKKEFESYRDVVAATALGHESFLHAKKEGEQVKGQADKMAEDAAVELKRLKDVARWKVIARDSTDDFSTKAVPAKAVKAAHSIASAASQSIEGIAASASSLVAPSKASHVPLKVFGGVAASFVQGKEVDLDIEDSWAEKIQILLDTAGDKASELTDAVSSALIKPTSTQGTIESVSSIASQHYYSALSAASNILYGTPQAATESIASLASERYSQAVTAASYAIYGSPTPIAASVASNVQEAWASITALASSQLVEGLSQASVHYTNAKIAVGAQAPPLHQQYLSKAQQQYYEGIGLAHDQYSRFVDAASTAVYGTQTRWHEGVASAASGKIYGTPVPAYESLLSEAQSQYSMVLAEASQKLNLVKYSANEILSSTRDLGIERLLSRASSLYNSATDDAADRFASATASASVAIYGTSTGIVESLASDASEKIIGTQTPWTEEMSSKAADNYNALIAKASEQIYGSPTPFANSVYNQAGAYAAQATDAAASQYAALHEIISELVVGKEPDYTESVYNRLSSAYYTGAPAVAASASSLASEAYNSASSVIASVFTPPAALEGLIGSANDQFQSAVDAASSQIYGTTKGYAEQAQSAAADGYSSIQSKASEAIYGTQPSYMEAAQSNLALAASNAQVAVSEVIYGTPTGVAEGAASSVAGAFSQATSIVGESIGAAGDAVADTYSSVSSRVSKAVYGPEYGTWESASSRIALAAESASAEIARHYAQASGSVGDAASIVGSKAAEVTEKVKDEL